MDTKEIKITVPWGTIAGKTWGNEKDDLILCIHGWADNANSFDLIIPQLPNCFYYVCIDLPGHGKSSPVETTLVLHNMDLLIVLKIVYKFLNRKKISLIGHSFGGCLILYFAQMYPQFVDKIVAFDVFHSYPNSPAQYFRELRFWFDNRTEFLNKDIKNSVYTKDEIMDRVINKRMTPISRKAAEIITERNLEPAENGKFRLTVSENIKYILFNKWTTDNLVDILQEFPIKCPHLLVMSSNSSFMKFAFRKVYKEYKKNPYFQYHVVTGGHDVHIENSERVAPLVSEFLLKHKNKL